MYLDDKTPDIYYRFDGAAEFIERADGNNNKMASDAMTEGLAFYGNTKNVREAAEMALSGSNDKSVNEIGKISEVIFDKLSPLIEKENISHDTEGAEIDISRYVDGEPECWMKFEPVIADGKGNRIISIAINFGMNCHINSDDTRKHGIFISTLTKCIEQAGYRVKIDLFKVSENNSNNELYFLIQNFKPADQELSIPHLFFWTGTTAIRRLYFSVMETIPEKYHYKYSISKSGSYSRSVSGTQEKLEKLSGNEYNLFIPNIASIKLNDIQSEVIKYLEELKIIKQEAVA